MTVTSVVIVGAGAVGTAAATQLRTLGFDGDLSLVHGERLVPYNRTTVNKTLLQPDARLESVRTVLPDDVRTVLLTGRAQRLDIPRRAVVLQDGSRLSYDAAIIATGARPRLLPAREGSLDGPWLSGPVTPLRTSDDAEHIRRLLADVGRRHERPARVGIVGASLLGSETADVLTTLGHEVFLIGAAADPLGPSVGHHHRAVDPDAARRAPRRPHRGPRRLAGGSRRRPQACPGNGCATLGWRSTTACSWMTACAPCPGGVRRWGPRSCRGVCADRALGPALAQGAHVARTISHDLRRTEDPGPFRPSGSYSTWLYGKAINVLGSPCLQRDREVDLAPPGHETHVTVFTSPERRVSAAVTLGSAKLANRLRPLVVARAAVGELADVVTATLSPTSCV